MTAVLAFFSSPLINVIINTINFLHIVGTLKQILFWESENCFGLWIYYVCYKPSVSYIMLFVPVRTNKKI